MGNSALGSTAADFPGYQSNDTAVNLARITSTISNFIILLYMTAIQYLLIRIRVSKSKIRHPPTSELYVAITALWLIHYLFDTLLYVLMNAMVQTICNGYTIRYFQLRDGPASELGSWIYVPIARTWQSNITLVFWEVLATWLICESLFLSIALLSKIPEARRDPSRVVAQFKTRFSELAVFMWLLFQETHPTFRLQTANASQVDNREKKFNDRRIGKPIELRRHHDENALEGKRTLYWDLKVDEESLHELKETLGPPGTLTTICIPPRLGKGPSDPLSVGCFGELGFNISQDSVCLGAMSTGTRFNLTFILETEKLQSGEKCSKKRKVLTSNSGWSRE